MEPIIDTIIDYAPIGFTDAPWMLMSPSGGRTNDRVLNPGDVVLILGRKGVWIRVIHPASGRMGMLEHQLLNSPHPNLPEVK
jgi:hypothetical protein